MGHVFGWGRGKKALPDSTTQKKSAKAKVGKSKVKPKSKTFLKPGFHEKKGPDHPDTQFAAGGSSEFWSEDESYFTESQFQSSDSDDIDLISGKKKKFNERLLFDRRDPRHQESGIALGFAFQTKYTLDLEKAYYKGQSRPNPSTPSGSTVYGFHPRADELPEGSIVAGYMGGYHDSTRKHQDPDYEFSPFYGDFDTFDFIAGDRIGVMLYRDPEDYTEDT